MTGLDHLDEEVRQALARPHTIDVTTIGRRTGQPRRIELVYHVIEGRVIISGLPGRRDWYANLIAHPAFTFHLKRPVHADLAAVARPITEPTERRHVMEAVTRNWQASHKLELYLRHSPLIEVTFPAKAA